jgi:hypothetical protein
MTGALKAASGAPAVINGSTTETTSPQHVLAIRHIADPATPLRRVTTHRKQS